MEVKIAFLKTSSQDPILGSENWAEGLRRYDSRFCFYQCFFSIFQEECRIMLLFHPVLFSKLRIHVSDWHFYCVHRVRFLELTKIGSLKLHRVNDPKTGLSRRVSDENKTCSISIHFLKITDPCVEGPFLLCSHDSIFGTNKSWILEIGSCERP